MTQLIDNILQNKLRNMINCINRMNSIILSYSGGIDSSLLAYIISNILKKKILCIFIDNNMISSKNKISAESFLKKYKINYKIINYNLLTVPFIKSNNKNRCFYCKYKMLQLIYLLKKKNKYEYILDGTNFSDISSIVPRPGTKAQNIFKKKYNNIFQSPFIKFKFTKDDIINLSKYFCLKDQISDSCLSTRIQYNTPITKSKLKIIESFEEILYSFGIKNVRLRLHIDNNGYSIARIEIDKKNFDLYFKQKKNIDLKLNEILKYNFITLDIKGYRSGSFDI